MCRDMYEERERERERGKESYRTCMCVLQILPDADHAQTFQVGDKVQLPSAEKSIVEDDGHANREIGEILFKGYANYVRRENGDDTWYTDDELGLVGPRRPPRRIGDGRTVTKEEFIHYHK